MLKSYSIFKRNDAHLVEKKDVWEKKKKRIVHSWGLSALNMQKYFWFVSKFEHVKFEINGKYFQKNYDNPKYYVLQPHFWKSVKMTLTFPKWGLWSPPGLPKLQSSILGVKTPCLETFLMSLESYWSVDVENGLAWAIWTFAA
jgi:hypothetical protein